MKTSNFLFIILVLALLSGVLFLFSKEDMKQKTPEQVTVEDQDVVEEAAQNVFNSNLAAEQGPVTVLPISHATMALSWNDTIFYTDPVGDVAQYATIQSADIILLTDIHGDHLNTETLQALVQPATIIIAPQAVFDELPEALQTQTTVMANGEELAAAEFTLTAVPMYNLPEDDPESKHVKGRGNGYVIDDGSFRVYIAGDTAATPEFRAQENIDMAFVPMNLPYTMNPTEAASGVAEMNPNVVYPYHFRTPEGFSDIGLFQSTLKAVNPDVLVVVLDWYQDTEADTASLITN